MDDEARKTVLIAGLSGFVGTRLGHYLSLQGYHIRGLGRASGNSHQYSWNPDSGNIDPEAMVGVDIVVNLAGESIAGGRWTAGRRQRILESRVKGTRLLVETMNEAKIPPAVFICSSGVNFYGSSESEVDERTPRGDGFLAEVCQYWESEAMRAAENGIRTVCLRSGIVLHPDGGVMAKLLPVFRMGLGGRVGSGEQGFPWISMEDLLRVYTFCMDHPMISGAVNAVHPERLSQSEFARELASSLSRIMGPPLPEFLVKALFGKMGEETLLADLRVHPRLLLDGGFKFRFSKLSESLPYILGKPIS